MAMTNDELEQRVNEIVTLLDDIIQGLNAVPTTTTLNAAILALQSQIDTLTTTQTSQANSILTLQNIVVNEP